MSNFAATSGPILGQLSPVVKTTSEIIDAFSNDNYVFLDVPVRFRIAFPLRFFNLEALDLFRDFRDFGDMTIEMRHQDRGRTRYPGKFFTRRHAWNPYLSSQGRERG
jgi:hypothetical protein